MRETPEGEEKSKQWLRANLDRGIQADERERGRGGHEGTNSRENRPDSKRKASMPLRRETSMVAGFEKRRRLSLPRDSPTSATRRMSRTGDVGMAPGRMFV